MIRSQIFCALGIALLTATNTHAGGPLALEGSSGSSPVHYSPSLVSINFDIGTLGTDAYSQVRTNSQADALVLQAFNLWNNVATATIQLSQGADLSADIDDTNYFDLMIFSEWVKAIISPASRRRFTTPVMINSRKATRYSTASCRCQIVTLFHW